VALISGKDVQRYEKQRYRGLDQRLVNLREQGIVRKIFSGLHAPGSMRQTLLDLPCGYGRFSGPLTRGNRFVIAADLSPGMVARTRERMALSDGPSGGKGGFAVMDIRNLPLKDRSVDVTFSMRLFHHGFARERMGELLLELSRVSRRWVILSYYRPTAVHALLRKVRGFQSHILMVGEDEFREHARKASLSIRQQYRLLPYLHAQVIAVLEKK
jgi:SAM-dependent methyltransferase